MDRSAKGGSRRSNRRISSDCASRMRACSSGSALANPEARSSSSSRTVNDPSGNPNQIEEEVVPDQDRRILGDVEPSRMRHVRVPPLELVLGEKTANALNGCRGENHSRRASPGQNESPPSSIVRLVQVACTRIHESWRWPTTSPRYPCCLGAIGREFHDGQFCFRGAATTTRQLLADAAPDLDQSRLTLRRRGSWPELPLSSAPAFVDRRLRRSSAGGAAY